MELLRRWFVESKGTVDVSYCTKLTIALFELLVWPHEVVPWFHTWCRGRVDALIII